MKILLLTLLSAFAISLTSVNALADEDAGAPGRMASRAVLDKHLATLKGANAGKVLDVEAPGLARSFEGQHFFALHFRKYPVAISPPPPLKPNNLFAVSGDTVKHLTTVKQLKEFFRKRLKPATSGEMYTDAAKSWLRLAQEFHHDGYFKFNKPTVELRKMVCIASAKVVQQRGDKGELTVTMAFVGAKLDTVKTGGKVLSGVRPRCQATRLLDADPQVRAIMRRDILVMGAACKSYLDEQRAKANPALRRAIDEVWRQILAEDR